MELRDNTGQVGAWTTATPAVTSTTGTITSAAGSTAYLKIGRTVHFWGKATITTNGTGATAVQLPLPFAPLRETVFVGREMAVNGNALIARASALSAVLLITKTDATYPGVDSAQLVVQGTYETAA